MTTSRTQAGGLSEAGSMYRQIAATCSSVFSLPPWLAAITPRLITTNRSTVTPTSRIRISAVTQPGSSPSTDRLISAAPVSVLSAIGSAILPKSVTSPRLRASRPSSRSVTDATTNAASAASRHPAPPANKHTTNTGTSRMRTTVSALAMFASPGGGGLVPLGGGRGELGGLVPLGGGLPWPGVSAGVALTAVSGARDEVGSRGLGHAGDHQVAGRQRAVRFQGGRPIHVRGLVRGAALVPAVAEHLLHQNFDRLAHPVRGALRHDLLGEAGEVADPAGDLILVHLVRRGEGGGLGAVLVGVAEDADRVQPRLAQEQLELAQVGGGLPGEADDEVRPDAGIGARVPDPVDQLGEPRPVAEPAHLPQHGAAGVLERQVEVRRHTRR